MDIFPRRQPDAARFKQVIRGEVVPKRPPFIELLYNDGLMEQICRGLFSREWVDYDPRDRAACARYHDNYMFCLEAMGFDVYPMASRFTFPAAARRDEASHRTWDEEGSGPITDWESFEAYPWPAIGPDELWDYEYVNAHLPAGMGFTVCPGRGFFEIPIGVLMGYETMSYLLFDDPALVEACYQRSCGIVYDFMRQILAYDRLTALFPGDDMGFNTSTMIDPELIRHFVFDWHRRAAELAHGRDVLYLLHSCGNVAPLLDDMIDGIKIDGKHSYEDSILPITEMKALYGDRIAVLGGVDMDKICRLPPEDLRRYVRNILDRCMPGGRFALGTGNTAADYIPLENYVIMLREGHAWGG